MATTRAPAIVHLTPDGIGPIIQGTDFYRPFRLRTDALPAPPFQATSVYAAGDLVSPAVADGFTYLVVPGGGGTSGASLTSATVLGQRVTSGGVQFMAVGSTLLLDTTGYTARAQIRPDFESDALFLMATYNNRLQVGFDPPKWTAATVYAAGQQVVPTTPNGWVYRVETGGTSHATVQPTWNTTAGQVNASADNGVVWRNIGSDADKLSNLRISLVPADTTPLANFAQALWDLELSDGVDTVRVMGGYATLSREMTR